jgi:hypothetical protein
MIWPSTTSFGMAIAQAPSGNFYIVGRYSPPGNAQGQGAWNVPGPNVGGGGPPPPPPPPTATGGDGVYLVNSVNGAQYSSGLAYYAHIGRSNTGQQPDAYIDIKTGGNVTWEGNTLTGTFNDGNAFTCSVNADGFAQTVGTAVGTAHNNFRGFTIHKDDDRVLYTINGWQVSTIYYCK